MRCPRSSPVITQSSEPLEVVEYKRVILKQLTVVNSSVESNAGDIALERYTHWAPPITSGELETLPKTVQHISGIFEPPSLVDRIPEKFPLAHVLPPP